MSLRSFLIVLLLLCPSYLCNPISTTSFSSTTTTPKSTQHSSSASKSSNKHPISRIPHSVFPTLSHSLQIFSRPPITQFYPPHPQQTHTDPPPKPTHAVKPSKHQSIIIVAEVLAGVVAFAVLLCCCRCFYVYRRTPAQDRIAAIVNRHQIQREMEEMERNPRFLRRTTSVIEPAPPYVPPPPSYDACAIPNQRREDYVEVPVASPSATPLLATAPLEQNHHL